MTAAVEAATSARLLAPPNPWVGACLVATDGQQFTGFTQRPGGRHAEPHVLAVARKEAGPDVAHSATLYVTLEPCSHYGRTPPCCDAIIEAGVSRVVVGVLDPDPNVAGSGIAALRDAGIKVDVGVEAAAVEQQLAPYLHHRRTGRPYVVLKLAATVDGQTAAPDGTSQWITGEAARADAHRIRAESDAIVVGAGTVRADNPRLTARNIVAADGTPPRSPLRVVLGRAPETAAVHPCQEMTGDLPAIVDELGKQGIVQVMVEGGATVAASFHQAGLVDRYVVYLAPAFMGGSDGLGLFHGPGVTTLSEMERLSFAAMKQLGSDVRLDLVRLPS